ncbi:hypothetical protein BI330_16645 [Mycobacterium sp. CBMA 623]|nr:hypothetical protein [Mycobacteroides sp. CBMA 326]
MFVVSRCPTAVYVAGAAAQGEVVWSEARSGAVEDRVRMAGVAASARGAGTAEGPAGVPDCPAAGVAAAGDGE